MSTSKTQRQGWLGELEHMLLLAILRLGNEAFAPAVSEMLEERARRRVSRGALYSTLDRMERKGFVSWTIRPGTEERSGHRRRRFELTPSGRRALQTSQTAIEQLSEGLGALLQREVNR